MDSRVGTLTELLRAGRGATPDIILDLLRGRYGPDQIPTAILKTDRVKEDPELHPLLFEWYFDTPSSLLIAEVALGAGREILCLGTPSVAAQLARSTYKPNVTLIDADESVTERFPELLHRVEVHVGELDAFSPRAQYQVVIADPPWYLTDVMRWLKVAQSHLKPGGTILMPIFPELTRPSAAGERTVIIGAAQRMGDAELWSGRLTYRTPGFERQAFRALGVPETGDWRSGDLLAVRKVYGDFTWAMAGHAHRGLEGWRRFQIGSQVVMLRELETTAHLSSTFVPIAGCPRNTLTSVSERDPRRALVGIWTSRNRVAAVGNTGAAARLLSWAAGDGKGAPDNLDSSWVFLQDLLLGR